MRLGLSSVVTLYVGIPHNESYAAIHWPRRPFRRHTDERLHHQGPKTSPTCDRGWTPPTGPARNTKTTENWVFFYFSDCCVLQTEGRETDEDNRCTSAEPSGTTNSLSCTDQIDELRTSIPQDLHASSSVVCRCVLVSPPTLAQQR